MTKEELKQEAGEYADKHAFRVPYDGSNKFYDDVDFKASKEGYLAGAETREKQIQIDAEHIRALQKQNGELTDRCRELEESLGKLQKSTFNIIDEKNNRISELEAQIKNITGLLNDILWKCTCKEYEKATQDLKELINELEVKKMTKKEGLEKEAEGYAEENQIYVGEYCSYNSLVKAYLASAEPREKRIEELEAQIEKMKNCKNCANYMISGKCPCFFRTGWCKNWEMAKGVSND